MAVSSSLFTSRLLRGGALVALLLCIGLAWAGFSYTRSVSALEEELQAFAIPPVAYGGITYRIEDGQIDPRPPFGDALPILRIARFSVEARLDPILALSGADLSLFAENLEHLEETRKDIEAQYASSSDEIERELLEHLYPHEFLKHLEALELARRELIARPSDEGLLRYEETFKEAEDAYRAHLSRTLGLLQAHDPSHMRFMLWGGVLTFESYARALTDIQTEADTLWAKADARFACGRHFSSDCLELSTYLALPIPEPLSENSEAPPAEANVHYGILDEYYRETPPLHFAEYVEEAEVPLAALTDTVCTGKKGPVYYRRWKFTGARGEAGMRTEELGDIYMYAADTATTTEYTELLTARGADLVYQGNGNYYLCAEAGKDTGRVLTLYALRDMILESGLRGGETLRTAYEKAAEGTITEEAIYGYLFALKEELLRSGERRFEEAYGSGSVLRAYRLMGIWRERSGYFEYQIGTMAFFNDRLLATPLHTLDPWYAIMTHNFASFLLLPYNRSVIREWSIPFYEARSLLDLPGMHLETVREGRLKGLPPHEALKRMQEYQRLQMELLRTPESP